jgi:energy-coupling factor transporter ATP-binding protein EcfA2
MANLYALNLDQIAHAIMLGGNKRTMLVQGHMGTGKTSLLKTLGEMLPTHTPCYFDCTTKDLGDLFIPNVVGADGQECVKFIPNEELGAHLGKPIILMFDEWGKANPSVKLGTLRTMLEREIGTTKLHPDSIVFATTNLGGENVGDMLPAHARNRISVVEARKPDNVEWIEWGLNNGIDHALMGWVKDTPQLFQSFEDVKDPDENPYIYHPRAQRAAFVTPRSLEAASDWLKVRNTMDNQTLTALLMGTIGDRGAMDLMAFVNMADQLPTLDEIKNNPESARIPSTAAAVCMVVFRTLSMIERDWADAWMTYMLRLDKEAQGLFANGVRSEKYSKRALVMTNKMFTKWAMDNNYLFGSDKV